MYYKDMVITYTQQSMDHPGIKVVNPARCQQLNRENVFFLCPRMRLRVWSRETGSAVPSRVSLLILHSQAEQSGAYTRFYIGMAITYTQKSVDPPGKVDNPARCQLKREMKLCSVPVFYAPESLVSLDGFSHPVPREPAHSS